MTKLGSLQVVGILLGLVGGLVLSFDVPVIRAAGGTPWLLLLVRSLLPIPIYLVIWKTLPALHDTPRNPLRSITWVKVGIVYGLSQICFTTSVFNTSTANLVFILAFNPLLAALLGDLMQHSVVTLKSGRLSLAGYRASVSSKDVEHWRKWEAFLLQRGNDLPLLSQVATQTGLTRKTLEKIARIAVNDGRLHKLTDTRYATPQQLAKLAQLVSDLVDDGQPITVINFKQRMGTGRKLAIEVLEYFDSIRFTRRSEDDRVILDAELPARLFNR